MSWYSIFYWLTVADGVKGFFDIASNIFLISTCCLLIIIAICYIIEWDDTSSDSTQEEAKKAKVNSKGLLMKCVFWTMFTWAGYIFLPTKRDALLIIAGGSVGNFITKDTAAKQIPSEVMTLLRDKLRSEIKEIHITDQIKDSLAGKTKEELIELIKNKK